MKVIIKPRAQKSIEKIVTYISIKGYPETALKFADRLEGFILTHLQNFLTNTKYQGINHLQKNPLGRFHSKRIIL